MTTNETENAEGQPTIVITFGDDVGTFRSHRYANQFLLAKHLDNVLLTGGYHAIKGVTDIVMDQTLPEDRPELERFLLTHGYADTYVATVYEALEKCWQGETSLPFGQSSESSDTISTPDGGSSSTDVSPSQDTGASQTEAEPAGI